MAKRKTGNKDISPEKVGKLDAGKKSRVPVYASIGDALSKHGYGTYFTTPKADRIYVITRGTWGDKSANKVVKGFPGKTPINKIKAFSKRTKVKHTSTPMPGTEAGKAKAGYATDKVRDLKKRQKPL
jgi:hypothetical protein